MEVGGGVGVGVGGGTVLFSVVSKRARAMFPLAPWYVGPAAMIRAFPVPVNWTLKAQLKCPAKLVSNTSGAALASVVLT